MDTTVASWRLNLKRIIILCGSHLIVVVQHQQEISSLNGGLMKKWMKTIVIFFLNLLLNACAFDLSHVKQIPTQIESTQLSKSSFELLDEVKVNLGTGYSRKLKKGTIWQYVGTISYGDIFKTDDQILTIEASNIYEAYIVISSDISTGRGLM